MSEKRIEFLLRKYSVRPDRKIGQIFLKDSRIASTMTKAAHLGKEDRVLEIGGGLGTITRWIAKAAGETWVVEIESGLVEALRYSLRNYDNVHIIHGNFLEIDLPPVNKVVSNLPYNISSKAIFRILEEMEIDEAVLMLQKKFAERLVAEPSRRSFSKLTINVQYHAEVEYLKTVPAEKSYPVPAVDSAIVRIIPREGKNTAEDYRIFKWLLRGVYSFPRKQFGKALRMWLENMNENPAIVASMLAKVDPEINGSRRLRSITLEELVALSDILTRMIDEETIEGPKE